MVLLLSRCWDLRPVATCPLGCQPQGKGGGQVRGPRAPSLASCMLSSPREVPEQKGCSWLPFPLVCSTGQELPPAEGQRGAWLMAERPEGCLCTACDATSWAFHHLSSYTPQQLDNMFQVSELSVFI